MQALILLSVTAVFLIFSISEVSRNDSVNKIETFKAGNVASNIFQYQDSIMQYGMTNYDSLHLLISISPGNVEQVKMVDYTIDQIGKYKQKNLLPFLNYKSVFFNYTTPIVGESQLMPVLYAASSWDDGYTSEVEHGYKMESMPEILGKLGEDLANRLYQGDSTYWVIPWIFSQSGCKVQEIYSQLPNDSNGNNLYDRLNNIFYLFCTQLKGSGYTFKQYVYISPVYDNQDI